jgi:hypothetical protein
MKLKMTLAALALALPFAASAEIPYNHVDVSLLSVDAGGNSDSESGIGLRGRFDLQDDFYAVGFLSDVDVTTLIAGGAGWRMPINNKADFFTELALARVDFDGEAENGFILNAGGRMEVMPKLELEASFNYVDIVDSDTGITFGGTYAINDQFGVGASFSTANDVDTLAVGVRITF